MVPSTRQWLGKAGADGAPGPAAGRAGEAATCRAEAIVTPGRISAPLIASQRWAALVDCEAPGADSEAVPASREARTSVFRGFIASPPPFRPAGSIRDIRWRLRSLRGR